MRTKTILLTIIHLFFSLKWSLTVTLQTAINLTLPAFPTSTSTIPPTSHLSLFLAFSPHSHYSGRSFLRRYNGSDSAEWLLTPRGVTSAFSSISLTALSSVICYLQIDCQERYMPARFGPLLSVLSVCLPYLGHYSTT